MNEFMKRSQEAKRYKEQYPLGTRIVLNQMSDPFAPVPSGTKGSVKYVDDMGQIHMHWDNGRSLAVIPGEDSFRKLTEQELLEEQGEVVEKETVAFGDDCRIVLPDEPIDCSELGYLQTYGYFSGTWLSDYVPNRLGGFLSEQKSQKPDCALIGENGNIFNLMGIAARVLREHDMKEQSEEMCNRIHQSGSYEEALNIIGEYVNITSEDGMDHGHGEDVGMHM